MKDLGLSTTANGTRIAATAYNQVIDAVRITGCGLDALILNDLLTIREGGQRIRAALVPSPRRPPRLELVDSPENCQAGC